MNLGLDLDLNLGLGLGIGIGLVLGLGLYLVLYLGLMDRLNFHEPAQAILSYHCRPAMVLLWRPK